MIAKMDRLEIIMLRDTLTEMVAFLQERGVMQMEDVPLAVENAPRYLHRIHLTDDQKVEADALEQLDTMLREIAPLLARKPSYDSIAAAAEDLQQVDAAEWRRKARTWSRELRSLSRRSTNIKDNLEILASYLHTLRQIRNLLDGEDVVLGKGARALVLRGESDAAQRHLERSMREAIGVDFRVLGERLGRHARLVVLLYSEDRDPTVSRVLKDEGISQVDLPDREIHGIPLSQAIPKLEGSIESQRETLTELKQQLLTYSQEVGPELAAMEITVADRLGRFRVLHHFAHSELIAVVRGWVPHTEAKKLVQDLETQFDGEILVEHLPVARVERSRIPILLQNPSALRPFEVLLSMMRPPSYGTLDPSILVGIFFVFFYGFILGDVVYGLIVLGFAYWIRRRFGRRYPVARSASTVGVYAAISSIIFGVLYGEYAGDLGQRLFNVQPLWIHRGHDVMTMLYVAIAIGAVHVTLSLLIAIWANYRTGHTRHMMEKMGLLTGLAGVGVLGLGATGAVPISPVVLALSVGLMMTASLVLLILGVGPRAPIQVLEIVSLASNVLSYCRLMALGMASVALADVANHMASTMNNLFIGIPVALGIHIINVAFGMFSPTLHSLRLNYVEFLPKFYEPEGSSFKPFRREILW